MRGKEANANSVTLRKLKKKPLICWTIDNALKSKSLNHIVVTSPDKKLIFFLKKKIWKKNRFYN